MRDLTGDDTDGASAAAADDCSRAAPPAEPAVRTGGDPALQRIAELAAGITGALAACVSVVDGGRLVSVAQTGTEPTDLPLDETLCGVALRSPSRPLLIEDATADPVFAEHPAVSQRGVRAYAGFPLAAADGSPLGVLCVLGDHPTALTGAQVDSLGQLADVTVDLLEARRLARRLKQTAADLRASQRTASMSLAQFQSVFELAPIGMTLVDSSGTYLSANAAFARLLGRSREDIVGRSWTELTTPDAAEQDCAGVSLLIAQGKGTRVHEKNYLHANGDLVPTLVSTSVVRAGNGQPWLLLNQVESMVDRRAADQRLASLHSAADGVVTLDDAGLVTSWNLGAERLLGHSSQQMVGRPLRQVLPASLREEYDDRLRRLHGPGTPSAEAVDVPVRQADGTESLMELTLSAWAHHGVLHCTAVLRDVTQRRLTDTCSDLVRSAASTANSVDSLAEAAVSVLRDVCARLGWVAGRAWTKDGGSASWHVGRHDHRTVSACALAVTAAERRASFSLAFPRDLKTPLLHSAADLQDSDIAQALTTCGVGTALSVPVLAAGEVAGVFAFYLPAGAPPPRQEVRDALEQIGVVLGQVVERERSMALLAFQATHDPLTHLANRRRLLEEISAVQQSLALGRESGRSAALLIDVDRFKLVNDSLGYVAGDQLLQEVSRRILGAVGENDVVGRLGSDEFVVLTRGISPSSLGDGDEPGVALAERLHQAVSGPTDIAGQQVPLRVSIGVCPIGPEHADVAHYPAAVLRDADAALRRAKGLGRSRIEVFDARLRRDTATRMDDETALSEAIASGGLTLHYQPIMSFGSGSPAGAEALVRWPRPGHGLVPPNSFIPLAEESGLIVELGRWVLMRACLDAASWATAVPELAAAYVSVNVSMRQLAHPQFLSHVDQALASSGLDPRRLVVEITESSLIDDAAAVEQVLLALRVRGIRLALDDFGTGYSSLGYVKALPVDILKIDKSFVDPITGPDQGTAFSEVVLKLAEATGLRTVAEGVESTHQAEALMRLGCDSAQGFLWSRPLPSTELHVMLSRLAHQV